MLYLLCDLVQSLFKGQAFKCSPGRWVAGVMVSFVGLVCPAYAEYANALQIPVESASFVRAQAFYYHDAPSKLSLAEIQDKDMAARFQSLDQERMFNLKPSDRLWIRIDIERLASLAPHSDEWALWIPLPLIDYVTMYALDPHTQQGVRQSAGDRVAVDSWPQPGRYPRFHIDLPSGRSSIFLEIQGSTPISLPLFLATEVQAQQIDRQGFMFLGLVMGLLLTWVLVCLVTSYTYRDKQYLLYGAYVMLLLLALMSYTGMAGYLIWSGSPMWADAAQGCLAILTLGGALYFVESILGGRQITKKLATVVLILAAATPTIALVYYFLPRHLGVIVLGLCTLLSAAVGLYLAALAWRRGDPIGLWVFIAYLPLAIAVLIAIARAYGVLSISWWVQYGVVAALVFEVPLMMVALNMRSRQRHEVLLRADTISTQDPLTGLLTEQIFDDRVERALARYTKRKEDAAVVLISMVNYDSIKNRHGEKIADQNVLRAVIKLRKVLRDVDTIARVGLSQFGVILEGVRSRKQISELGARLVAQGLMPLPGLVPEVTLHFHVVSWIFAEVGVTDHNVKQGLTDLLDHMSPRTRRPIRFIDVQTDADADSSIKYSGGHQDSSSVKQDHSSGGKKPRKKLSNVSSLIKKRIDNRSPLGGVPHQGWSASSGSYPDTETVDKNPS